LGLGYVGLPLAVEFSKVYSTIGFDIDESRINELNKSFDRTFEVNKSLIKKSNLTVTSSSNDLSECNIYIITVPTPVDIHNNPDMTSLASASKMVGNMLKKNDTVIYESTVYPGTTEEFCVPILEKASQLIYNKDFFCGYSPERINPGDKDRTLTKIIKITSGSDEKTAKFVDKLYQSILSVDTYKATSIAIAEAAKVIENIQRDVNIALINELSMIFNKLGLDTNEVLEAAGTKWNFLPFRPGLVGGHCIGVDPYYLTHRATEIGYHPEMILAGRRINDNMGKYIAECTIAEMAKAGINTVNAKVAVLGITFKENCPDIRNTKVSDIINNLIPYGCQIDIVDPYANSNEIKDLFDIDLVDLKKIKNCSAVVLCVAHNEFKSISKKDWEKIINKKGVLIDVKSLFSKGFFKNLDIYHWRL